MVTSRECGGGIKGKLYPGLLCVTAHIKVFSDNIRFDRCTERELGGTARVTVCHCDTDGCNQEDILAPLETWSWWDVFSVLNTRV